MLYYILIRSHRNIVQCVIYCAAVCSLAIFLLVGHRFVCEVKKTLPERTQKRAKRKSAQCRRRRMLVCGIKIVRNYFNFTDESKRQK